MGGTLGKIHNTMSDLVTGQLPGTGQTPEELRKLGYSNADISTLGGGTWQTMGRGALAGGLQNGLSALSNPPPRQQPRGPQPDFSQPKQATNDWQPPAPPPLVRLGRPGPPASPVPIAVPDVNARNADAAQAG